MYTVDLSCYKIIHPGKTENMKSSNYDDIYAHYECLETSDQNCITKAQFKKEAHCLGWRNEHQLTLKGGRPHVKKTPEGTSHSHISLINRRTSTEVHREGQRGDNLKVSVTANDNKYVLNQEIITFLKSDKVEILEVIVFKGVPISMYPIYHRVEVLASNTYLLVEQIYF